jgi:hypothetical protein
MNELTKIIFEKLGIEPGEEFQIQYYIDNIYRFDERLNLMTRIKGSVINGCCWYDAPADFLRGLINGQLKIIKISKPLLTDEEKEFLKYFRDWYALIKDEEKLHLFKRFEHPTYIELSVVNLNFANLENEKRYSREELGL